MKNNGTTIHPFPGLRPFEEWEEHLFFGREKSVTELLSRLRTSRFLAVIGASGSGKSSLVKAGLLPAIYRGFMAGTGSGWRVALFRPGDNPIGNLAGALGKAVSHDRDEDNIEDGSSEMYGKLIETTLRRSQRGLVDVVKQARLPQHENLLVVIDQFEEIFRFSKLERSQQEFKRDSTAFIKLLLESCEQSDFPIYVLLTMRSDFLGDCTEFRDLPESINRGQYLIPRMTREEKRMAIAGPAAVGSGEISPVLLSRLLNEVGENPDHLPILQHALMRTWDYWLENREQGEPLGLKHYEAIGTMERALSRHAEEAFSELKNESSQDICEKIFKLLTDRGETGRGVRRPAAVKEICAVTAAPEKEVIRVINVFRQPGRTFLMPPSEEKLSVDSVIDISHESLMRIWTRLIRWVAEEAKSADQYQHLAKTARLYGEEKASLFRDPELMLTLIWREKNEPNRAWAQRYDPSFDRAIKFLEASKKQQEYEIAEKEREQKAKIKTARIVTIVISFTALLSIVFGIWAFHLKGIAEEAKEDAENARNDAITKKNEALEQREKAVEKTIEAYIQKKIATKSEEKARELKIEAEENASSAKKAEILAKESAGEARKSQVKEKIQGFVVEMNRKEADFLQHLAKAKELAVRSVNESRDKELKALLALASHILYKNSYDKLFRSLSEILEKFNDLYNRNSNLDLGDIGSPKERYDEVIKKSKTTPKPAEIFAALREAYIVREDSQDIIYEGAESWALAAAGNNNIVFNQRDGKLLLAPLRFPVDAAKLPLINNKESRRLSQNNIIQAGSLAVTDKRLFCGSMDGSLFSWDRSNWIISRLPGNHKVKILSMAFAANKNCLFYSVKNKIYRYDLNSREAAKAWEVITFEGSNLIRALAIIEDTANSILIAADAKGNIYHYDLSGDDFKKKRLNAEFESSRFFAITYNPKGKLLALANSKGEIFLFPNIDCGSLKSGTKIQSCRIAQKHKGIVRTLAFSPKGSFLASGGWDGTIMLWDVKGKSGIEITKQAPILTFKSKLKILSLIFDEKEEHMIFCDEQNLRICPTNSASFYEKLCQHKIRKFRKDEWDLYIGDFIKQEDITIRPQEKEE